MNHLAEGVSESSAGNTGTDDDDISVGGSIGSAFSVNRRGGDGGFCYVGICIFFVAFVSHYKIVDSEQSEVVERDEADDGAEDEAPRVLIRHDQT